MKSPFTMQYLFHPPSALSRICGKEIGEVAHNVARKICDSDADQIETHSLEATVVCRKFHVHARLIMFCFDYSMKLSDDPVASCQDLRTEWGFQPLHSDRLTDLVSQCLVRRLVLNF